MIKLIKTKFRETNLGRMVNSAADPNSQYSHFLLDSPTCKNKNRWFRSIITFALTQLKITASTISNCL